MPLNTKGYTASIIDEVGVFSNEEIEELQNYLDKVIEDLDIDIVVLFDEEYCDDVEKHAKEYFLSKGYEYGVIYEVNLNVSEYAISYLNNIRDIDYEIEQELDELYPYLKNDDFYNSVKHFADFVYNIYTDEIYNGTGQIEENTYEYVEPQTSIKDKIISCAIPACIISGIIVAVTLLILFRQLKTERKQVGAKNYQVNSNFNLLRSGDIYLYTTTSRIKINNNNNNMNNHIGHSSGSHFSSHGSFSGGGSHKF